MKNQRFCPTSDILFVLCIDYSSWCIQSIFVLLIVAAVLITCFNICKALSETQNGRRQLSAFPQGKLYSIISFSPYQSIFIICFSFISFLYNHLLTVDVYCLPWIVWKLRTAWETQLMTDNLGKRYRRTHLAAGKLFIFAFQVKW